jgi:CDP-4-dehydro-6-deoxyglucose reductase
MPYSCRMGTCTTCRGKILEGEVDFGDVHPSYLTNEQKAARLALLCQAKAKSDLVLEVNELPRLTPPKLFRGMVRGCSKLARDVAIMDLRLPLHQNFMFAAGQYIDVLLPDGRRRSYSIANPPAPQGVIDVQFHIRHMPGGAFTDLIFERGLKEREMLQCKGPLGTFFLRDESDKPIVFLASGTGYAPIRSIVLDLFRRGVERSVVLYWGARTKQDLYMLDEPQTWSGKHSTFKFVPVLSEALSEDDWTGRTGFVHHAVMEDLSDLSAYQVYACGVPVMVNAARKDFVQHCHLPPTEFFADSFVTEHDLAGPDAEGR